MSSEEDLSDTDRPRLMAIAGPRRAALDIPEILENVLSFLPPRALFGVQRVSHLWKGTIAASPPIQENMFLRIRTKTPEIWMLTNPKPVPRGSNGEDGRAKSLPPMEGCHCWISDYPGQALFAAPRPDARNMAVDQSCLF
jgi:hypothetical protein